jgi:hypothetical protein
MEFMEKLIWDSFSSGLHNLYCFCVLDATCKFIVWDAQSIQGCGYDCNVICVSCGMFQFCCLDSLYSLVS